MLDDERTVTDTEQGGASANPEGSQGQTEQANPTAGTTASPDYESIITARIQAAIPSLRDELRKELIRTNQSDEDRLLNRLTKRLGNLSTKLPIYEEIGKELGLDEAAIQEKQNNALLTELRTVSRTPEPETQTPAPQAQPVFLPYANEQEILPWLASQGLKATDVDLTDILHQPKSDELAALLDERVTIAKAAKIQAKRNTEAAKPIAQTARATGGLGSPLGGAPSAGLDPKTELEQLMTQEPPNDPVSLARYEQRLKELYEKAKW